MLTKTELAQLKLLDAVGHGAAIATLPPAAALDALVARWIITREHGQELTRPGRRRLEELQRLVRAAITRRAMAGAERPATRPGDHRR